MEKVEQQGSVKIEYQDVMDAIFSNHVQVIKGPEAVFLDFCQIQVQDVLTNPKTEKKGFRAIPKVRIVLTNEKAEKLAEIINSVLKESKA
jgi:hypothetical protein